MEERTKYQTEQIYFPVSDEELLNHLRHKPNKSAWARAAMTAMMDLEVGATDDPILETIRGIVREELGHLIVAIRLVVREEIEKAFLNPELTKEQ